ncbi:MAG: hypothetical protein ABI791_03815 [Acidobacteriota bacterium]
MKHILLAVIVICIVFQFRSFAQTTRELPAPNYSGPAPATTMPNDTMSGDISRISRSVEELNRNLSKFFTNFSSNQGLKLSERQQKLLFALEVLTRTETSFISAQKQRLDHLERQSRLRLQLAMVNDNLLPQSLDRYVALRGTLDATELRESRRTALQKERQELSNTVDQLQIAIDRLNEDIRRSESLIASLRMRLFGEVEKELADL